MDARLVVITSYVYENLIAGRASSLREINMPLIPGMIDTFDKLKELHKKKNDDYAGDRGPFYNFQFAQSLANHFENARDKIYITMIAIKLARLAVLLSKTNSPVNEGIDDTFDDLINYCAIWKCSYIESKRGARLSDAQINSANTV